MCRTPSLSRVAKVEFKTSINLRAGKIKSPGPRPRLDLDVELRQGRLETAVLLNERQGFFRTDPFTPSLKVRADQQGHVDQLSRVMRAPRASLEEISSG